MKSLLIIILNLLVIVSASATEAPKHKPFRKFAQEEIKCGNTVDDVVKQISIAPGCYEGMNVAKNCAYGSSADTQIVEAAEKICQKDFKSMSKSDQDLNSKMRSRCESVCNPKTDGTMCLSQIAFCKLSATEFWAQFYSSNI